MFPGVPHFMVQTPLYPVHKEMGASFIDFFGYEMPLKYGSIKDEHLMVRKKVGLFDVSHMGNIWVRGRDALSLLDSLMVEDPSTVGVGKGQYTVILREDGTIIDDEVFFHLPNGYLFVPNVGMHDTIAKWFQSHAEGFDVSIEDVSMDYVILAVQGPLAQETVQKLFSFDISSLGFFACRELNPDEINIAVDEKTRVILSHTGYTGEKGFEIQLTSPAGAVTFFQSILQMGKAFQIQPIGLGARDTLRLEKCFALASNEFKGGRTPLEAGMGWLVNWNHDFVGKDALLAQKEEPYDQMTYLKCNDKGIPRQGCPVQYKGKRVGIVSSGTLSPCLNTGIAMAYVNQDYRTIDQDLDIVIRGKPIKASVVKMPFVKKGAC